LTGTGKRFNLFQKGDFAVRMKKEFIIFFLLLFSNLAFSATENQEVKEFPDPALFPLPSSYKPNVEFWMRVYGEWDDNKMVIHDSSRMNVVFDVIAIPDDNNLLRIAARANLDSRIKEIKKILMDLQRDPSSRQDSAEHKRIYDLYSGISDPNKFGRAAENLRVQQGIRPRFQRGLEQMTMYLSQIKRIFRDEGLPDELAYLPLVESSFNNVALSKTRAAGIWQFMSGTAKHYMKVNSDVDERLDPMIATRAAALYLKRSHDLFGNWPVAIMSYNHGQQGIANAIKNVGSADFMDILNGYSGRYFGFASRNFYGEFLAACKVMNDAEKYFGPVNYARPVISDSVKLSRPLSVSTLINNSTLTREEIRIHNPALQSAVLFSRRPIPTGYQLRLPPGRFPDLLGFIANLRGHESSRSSIAKAEIPKQAVTKVKTKRASASGKLYVVRRGDTLFSISRRFSTTVNDIRKINGLDHSHIFPGQRLFVTR
jgi:membrane-bound lytic murein transglycosylase D